MEVIKTTVCRFYEYKVKYDGQIVAATTVIWSQNRFHKLQISGTIPKNIIVIYENNQEAIKLAENPIFQKQSKHIAVKYHYTRDFIQSSEITLEYKKRQEMITDSLTKLLGPHCLSSLQHYLDLYP